MATNGKLKLAVIGAGRWGPNLLRNFHLHPDCEVAWVCDQDPARLQAIQSHYQNAFQTTSHWQEAVNGSDAVIICTPTATHYTIAKAAIQQGKHVFVEKPLTTRYTESIELVELAKQKNCKLMVGHVFLFNPVVQEIKRLLERNALGKLHYLYSIRTNMGPIRADVNALWDLAPHDISIVLHLLGENPEEVHGFGGSYINHPTEDVAFSWLRFSNGVIANIHVSWLDPKKVRQLVIVGSQKMLVFDDMSEQPLKIFDKNVGSDLSETMIQDTIHHFRKSIFEGAVEAPHFEAFEPLKNECHAFVDWVLRDIPQPSTGELGAEVVRVLEKVNERMSPIERALQERREAEARNEPPSVV